MEYNGHTKVEGISASQFHFGLVDNYNCIIYYVPYPHNNVKACNMEAWLSMEDGGYIRRKETITGDRRCAHSQIVSSCKLDAIIIIRIINVLILELNNSLVIYFVIPSGHVANSCGVLQVLLTGALFDLILLSSIVTTHSQSPSSYSWQ